MKLELSFESAVFNIYAPEYSEDEATNDDIWDSEKGIDIELQ